jgi:hypothetical protein
VGSKPRTVFVSYRRHLSWAQATLVYNDLRTHGFDAFMDLRDLDSGEFDRAILDQIETRVHFVVVLVPGSLDRIGQGGDWLRREIAYALAHDRNVVPVTADGFEFRDLVLPPDVARLAKFNAVSIPPGYFESAMERLRTKFLKEPSPSSVEPSPSSVEPSPSSVEPSPSSVEPSAPWVAYEGSPLPRPALTGRRHPHNPIRVELTWSEIPGADGYVLQRVSEPVRDRDFREVYRGPDRVYEDAPAASTTTASWRYRVRAVRSPGRASEWSDEVSVTTGF